jgi:hypothetical protein
VAEAAADAGQPLDPASLSECRVACEPSECCDIPSQFRSSCLRGNEELCMAYHQECFVISLAEYGDSENPFVLHDSDVIVPEAPPTLKDTCSLNDLTSNAGVAACTKVCEPYSCCYDTNVTSCTNQATCQGYSPCLNLRSHSTLDDTITKEVNALCRRNKLMQSIDNRKECNNACKLARCCFGGDGCYTQAEGFCSQYKMCGNLYGEKSDKLKDLDDATYDDYYDDDDGGTYDGDDGTFARALFLAPFLRLSARQRAGKNRSPPSPLFSFAARAEAYYDDDANQDVDDDTYIQKGGVGDENGGGAGGAGGTGGAGLGGGAGDGAEDDTYDDKYDDQTYDDQYYDGTFRNDKNRRGQTIRAANSHPVFPSLFSPFRQRRQEPVGGQ